MMSEMLKKAQEYEVQQEKKIAETERPVFHLTPRVGWMNDPNGFSRYGERYHMFYQYYPYGTNWGPMHWGHAVSRDLLHWEYLPAAMAPDQEYDHFGCFSGGAVEDENGNHMLMYTGVSRENGQEVQTQCIAIGDGVTYQKYEKNPVLTGKDLPEGASTVDFRDPRIWRETDGTYRCAVGNRSADGSGQILLFQSENGLDWKFEQILSQNQNRYGKMWECPDFFSLDGYDVLLVSPQDMEAVEKEFIPGNGTLCVLGHLDEEHRLAEEKIQTVDYGIDFYAPQTVEAPDGRRIMIGWMQNWDTCGVRNPESKWFGQMSCPREIRIENGKLYQQPVRELAQYYGEKVSYQNVVVEKETHLDGICGSVLDLQIELIPAEGGYEEFILRFAKNEKHYSEFHFEPEQSLATIDRTHSGVCRAVMHQRTCVAAKNEGKLKIRMILDRFSAEIFLNDGEQVMTMTLYTEGEAEEIQFSAKGKVCMNVVAHRLEK